MKKINAIVFDLGGVILNINYQLTINAFKKLGIKNPKLFYSKKTQENIFNKLEEGKISNFQFIEEIKKKTNNAKKEKILLAWNAMLLNLPKERIECIKRLKNKYRIFLLSNTNNIHITSLKKEIGNNNWLSFINLFEKTYLSYEIGFRKPSKDIFRLVLKENKLKAEEVLFIDDSYQHIKSAKELQITTHHLKDSENINLLFSDKSLLKLH